jgi:hypothetical protein
MEHHQNDPSDDDVRTLMKNWTIPDWLIDNAKAKAAKIYLKRDKPDSEDEETRPPERLMEYSHGPSSSTATSDRPTNPPINPPIDFGSNDNSQQQQDEFGPLDGDVQEGLLNSSARSQTADQEGLVDTPASSQIAAAGTAPTNTNTAATETAATSTASTSTASTADTAATKTAATGTASTGTASTAGTAPADTNTAATETAATSTASTGTAPADTAATETAATGTASTGTASTAGTAPADTATAETAATGTASTETEAEAADPTTLPSPPRVRKPGNLYIVYNKVFGVAKVGRSKHDKKQILSRYTHNLGKVDLMAVYPITNSKYYNTIMYFLAFLIVCALLNTETRASALEAAFLRHFRPCKVYKDKEFFRVKFPVAGVSEPLNLLDTYARYLHFLATEPKVTLQKRTKEADDRTDRTAWVKSRYNCPYTTLGTCAYTPPFDPVRDAEKLESDDEAAEELLPEEEGAAQRDEDEGELMSEAEEMEPAADEDAALVEAPAQQTEPAADEGTAPVGGVPAQRTEPAAAVDAAPVEAPAQQTEPAADEGTASVGGVPAQQTEPAADEGAAPVGGVPAQQTEPAAAEGAASNGVRAQHSGVRDVERAAREDMQCRADEVRQHDQDHALSRHTSPAGPVSAAKGTRSAPAIPGGSTPAPDGTKKAPAVVTEDGKKRKRSPIQVESDSASAGSDPGSSADESDHRGSLNKRPPPRETVRPPLKETDHPGFLPPHAMERGLIIRSITFGNGEFSRGFGAAHAVVRDKCQLHPIHVTTVTGKTIILQSTEVLLNAHRGNGTIYTVERFKIDDKRYSLTTQYRRYIENWVARAMVAHYAEACTVRTPLEEIYIPDRIPYRNGTITPRRTIYQEMGGPWFFPTGKVARFYFHGPDGKSYT